MNQYYHGHGCESSDLLPNLALASTDSLRWLREEKAKELEELIKVFRCGMKTTTSTDMRLTWKRAIECCEDRIAELRRED